MLPFFHHPLPLPIQLACSKTLPSDTLLWQTERQKEQKDLSISPFSFPLVSASILHLGHLDQASKHCPSQGSFHQKRHPNSVSQRHSIDNFFQALSSIPFVLLSALFLPTWQAGECRSCLYYHWVIQDTPYPSQWLTTHYHGWYLPMPVSMPRPTSGGKLHQ